jgi:hypothetical protein
MRTTAVATLAITALLCASVATFAAASASPPHFAGLPAVGVNASTPTTGRLIIGLRPTATIFWNVYADGRVIWQKWTRTPFGDATVVPVGARRPDTGWVQQRLTSTGVRLLLSKVLSTGLFEHNLMLNLGKGHAWVLHQVRRGDRMVTVDGVSSPDPSWNEHFDKATPPELRSLTFLATLVAHPDRWLPAKAWANRQIRPFVPARYMIAVDRGYPDLSKLPSPARETLSQYQDLRRHACQILTTSQARALLQAFATAGIFPSDNHADNIAFDAAALGSAHPTYLHLSPSLPGDHC